MITNQTPPPSPLGSASCYASSCGRATLYHGRWQDLLPLPVDAIITDQPYGTGWIRGGGKKEGQFKRRSEKAEWDIFDVSWLERAPEVVAAFCPIQGVWEMCLMLTQCATNYAGRTRLSWWLSTHEWLPPFRLQP